MNLIAERVMTGAVSPHENPATLQITVTNLQESMTSLPVAAINTADSSLLLVLGVAMLWGLFRSYWTCQQ